MGFTLVMPFLPQYVQRLGVTRDEIRHRRERGGERGSERRSLVGRAHAC